MAYCALHHVSFKKTCPACLEESVADLGYKPTKKLPTAVIRKIPSPMGGIYVSETLTRTHEEYHSDASGDSVGN